MTNLWSDILQVFSPVFTFYLDLRTKVNSLHYPPFYGTPPSHHIPGQHSWMYLEQPFWNSGFIWMFSCLSSRLFTGFMLLSVLLSIWPDTSWQIASCHRLTSLNFYFLVIYWKDIPIIMGFPCGSAGKKSACNVGVLGSIPGFGRSLGEGKGYPPQYSGLENSMDYCKELDMPEQLSFSPEIMTLFIGLWSPYKNGLK